MGVTDVAGLVAATAVENPICAPRQSFIAPALEVVDAAHPERLALEGFIAEAYWRNHGAHIRHFADHLVGLRRRDASWSAGAGYSLAGRNPLFLEQYLDQPAELEIAARLQVPVSRSQIVEVGNLAALGSGEGCNARALIVGMARLLQGLGRPWVVFTATQALRNSFARLGVTPLVLAGANPARLSEGGASWGSYYDNHPQVMAANIHLGLALLASKAESHAGLRKG